MDRYRALVPALQESVALMPTPSIWHFYTMKQGSCLATYLFVLDCNDFQQYVIVSFFSRLRNCPLNTAIQYQGQDNEIKRKPYGEDLHIFKLDERNLNESISNFNKVYSKRSGQRKEIWLLESTFWTEKFSRGQMSNRIIFDFKDTLIDLDDDLYFFSGMY